MGSEYLEKWTVTGGSQAATDSQSQITITDHVQTI